MTAYNQTGSLAWPVLVLWGPSANHTDRGTSGIVDRPDFEGVVARMSCPRAKDATEGSTVPGSVAGTDEDSGKNAGNRGVGLPSLVAIGVVMMFVEGLSLW